MKGLGADGPYWQALSAGHLEMQQCNQCGKWNWPAVWRCGECGSWDHTWHERPLSGEIYSWTRTWHDFGTPAELEIPYVSVVVTLENTGGCRLLGVLEPTPKHVEIGSKVTGAIRAMSIGAEKIPALRWTLLEETR